MNLFGPMCICAVAGAYEALGRAVVTGEVGFALAATIGCCVVGCVASFYEL